jgi:hypothetical protein
MLEVTPSPTGPRERRLALHLGVWSRGLIVALTFLFAGAAWAVSSTPGSSPDDDFHLPSIWCADLSDSSSCPKTDSQPSVPVNVVRAPCYAFNATVSGACSYSLSHEPVPARVNDGIYPGLFYDAMHLFVGDSVAESVVRMRLANTVLAALLLGAAAVVLPPLLRRAVLWSWLTTLVPLGIFLVASTNPSSWVVIGVGTYWAFLWNFLDEPRRKASLVSGLLAAISATLAAGARADGAAYICLSTAAVGILALRRHEVPWRRLVLPLVVVAAMTYVYLSSGQSASLGGFGVTAGAGRTGSGLLLHNLYYLPSLIGGIFGIGWGLGWLDTVPEPLVGALAVAVCMSLTVAAVAAMWGRKALAISLLGLALVAIPLYTLQGGGNFVGENVQPRYILPLAMVLVGITLSAERSHGRTWSISSRGLGLLVVAASVANLLALHTNIRRYVTGLDVSGVNLNPGREWWWATPVSPTAVWIAGSVAGLLFFAGLVLAGHVPASACADHRTARDTAT